MDIRITNTKNRIQEALISCMSNSSLIEIRDKDIINKAQIASGTFYKYYADKEAVLKDIEKGLYANFQTALLHDAKEWQIPHSPHRKDIFELIENHITALLKFFISNRKTVLALTSKNGDPDFTLTLFARTDHVVEHLMAFYFHLYRQENILLKNRYRTDLITEHCTHAFFDSLLILLAQADHFSVSDMKKVIAQSIVFSPYDLAQHHLH